MFVRCLFVFLALAPLSSFAADEVNIYSYRQPYLIKPLLQAFEQETGIKANLVYAKQGLIERLQREARNSPADLLLTADIGRLLDMKDAGLSQPVQSDVLEKNIPQNFRDAESHWSGLTSRARIIVASKQRVQDQPASYEDLANPEWQGRICTRSGKHDYMVALIAAMITHHGLDDAQTWLNGVKNSLARKPQGNDRAQVKAIHQGECDIAVINHYYMALMQSDPEQTEWANAVNIIFPNQADRGAHMNVSGIALTKHAPNRDHAIRLMEFLSEQTAQKIYAQENSEYPVNEKVAWSDLLESWGQFKIDQVNLSEVAKHRADAVKLVDITGYDN